MSFKLKAEIREVVGKKTKKLRRTDLVPAAVFGFGGNLNVQVSQKEFQKIYAQTGNTAIIELDLGDKKHSCFVDEAQLNYVTGEFLHISFKEVNLNVETTSEVPFEIINAEVSPAVKDQDSLVILSKTSVLLRGLPKDLPQVLTIDATEIKAGDTVLLKDIKLDKGVEIVHEDQLEDVVVTTVSAVQNTEDIDVNAAMAEATATPETESKEEEK